MIFMMIFIKIISNKLITSNSLKELLTNRFQSKILLMSIHLNNDFVLLLKEIIFENQNFSTWIKGWYGVKTFKQVNC